MADNRMFLIHKPSKIGIMLGKSYRGEWYNAPEASELDRFYKYIYSHYPEEPDDFMLAMENCSQSECFNDWQYTSDFIDGFRVFKYK